MTSLQAVYHHASTDECHGWYITTFNTLCTHCQLLHWSCDEDEHASRRHGKGEMTGSHEHCANITQTLHELQDVAQALHDQSVASVRSKREHPKEGSKEAGFFGMFGKPKGERCLGLLVLTDVDRFQTKVGRGTRGYWIRQEFKATGIRGAAFALSSWDPVRTCEIATTTHPSGWYIQRAPPPGQHYESSTSDFASPCTSRMDVSPCPESGRYDEKDNVCRNDERRERAVV